MAILSNHYESAFLQYIRERRIGCICVDESCRSWDRDQSLKSLDFILTPPGIQFLLVDVKGRKTKAGGLDNWATRDDIESLGRWEQSFGSSAVALLVFVYELKSDPARYGFNDTFTQKHRQYGFLAVGLDDYRQRLRVRSRRWDTVCVPRSEFRKVARPISYWLEKT